MRELVRCGGLMKGILGDGIKSIQPCEYDALNTQRKSLYARVDIAQGDTVIADDIVVKGPAGGLQPRYLDVVAGRTARRDIEADHPITWDDI